MLGSDGVNFLDTHQGASATPESNDFVMVVTSSGNESKKAEAEAGRAEDWFIPGVPTGYKGADFVKDVEATFPTLAGKFGGEID